MVMQKILLLEVKRESCIMSKARKEFTFDLDTKKLKDIFGEKSYTKAYNELFEFFCRQKGFEHRQGSIYCSKNILDNYEVLKTVGELSEECPWLVTALRRMDVADIGEIHELTEWITQRSETKSIHDYTLELFRDELQANGFVLTDRLGENYQKLTDSRGDITSLEEISAEYRSGSADENINAIGNELKAQELQLIDELAAPEI